MGAPPVQDPAAREQSPDPGLLIIFVRKPELGLVKTRLAGSIGAVSALKVYKELLHRTESVCKGINIRQAVYYAGETDTGWEGARVCRQAGYDLGQRMESAFRDSFESGHKKVVIIGSDCPELNETLILQAFLELDEHDIVLGPAQDGGYYLLGMTQLFVDLFRNKQWSTKHVLEDTLREARRLQKSVALLKTLNDLDTLEDLQDLKNRGLISEQNFLTN